MFADVDPDTLLIDPESVARRIGGRTRAVVAVDYAGQPCEYDSLRRLCETHGPALLADACHSLGASYYGRQVGSLAEMSAFSFHPVKPITTGEGGIVTTDDPELEAVLRRWRNHGIDRDARERGERGTWMYDMIEFGINARLSDLHAALGRSQLRRLDTFTARTNVIRKWGRLRASVPKPPVSS
ncbi:MAG: UDP-4-amino-4-deoxy-L-arabinose--oxoglutarate aminotransferase [Calditrichaeota bacterium]|nr:UDP-4-amino-4-deoxy-L-arabinose--oxoglutarate aminotransferase [Calditrichota bacterium]